MGDALQTLPREHLGRLARPPSRAGPMRVHLARLALGPIGGSGRGDPMMRTCQRERPNAIPPPRIPPQCPPPGVVPQGRLRIGLRWRFAYRPHCLGGFGGGGMLGRLEAGAVVSSGSGLGRPSSVAPRVLAWSVPNGVPSQSSYQWSKPQPPPIATTSPSLPRPLSPTIRSAAASEASRCTSSPRCA